MSTVDIAARLAAIAPELTKLGHLPALRSVGCWGASSIIHVEHSYLDPWSESARIAEWAAAFDVPVKISLSFTGGGDVTAAIELAGHELELKGSLNTAHAYQLGGALGEQLAKDKPITITAARLLEVVAQLGAATASQGEQQS